MKWKDLSLKERKQIYDTVRADNPNATYFDIKKEFDTIPEYEEGKGSRWYENKHTRDSISNVQEQYWLNRNNDANKFKSPSLEELANDTTVSGSSEKVDKEVNLVMNALRNQINNNTLEASVKDATISNYDNRVKRLEPIKEVAKVSSVLGQMALGGGSIVAKEAGNLALGAALQGASALWDGIEAIQNINNNDKLGIVQNVVPIISQGLTTLKYLPSKYNNSLTNNLQSIGSNLGPIWDFSVNPIMESYKSNKESNSIEVPSYEEGGKIKLPPENVPGTSEYFARQKRISGSVESVQPEAYITPAGYIKDAINFVSELSNGDYKDAAVSALMNVIPFGAGKVFKKIKNKTNVINGAVNELNSYAEPFAPTVTKKAKKSKVKKESDYDDEFNEVIRKSKNVSKYEKEISRSVEDAVFPDDETMNLINFVDEGYGTNYKRSYRDIAMRDMTNRGKYVKFEDLGPGHYGTMKGRKGEGDTYSIDDFMIKLNPDYYLPGTANHELSHLADGLNNPYTKSVAGAKDTHYGNKYLDYLADYDNMYTVDELRKSGNSNLISSRNYLSDPTEVKAHMIGLKRALINSGNISRWSDKINKSMLDTYFDPRNASNYINEVSRNMYDLYRNKQGFVNRMNMLVPMEYAAPIGITGLAGYELNKE